MQALFSRPEKRRDSCEIQEMRAFGIVDRNKADSSFTFVPLFFLKIFPVKSIVVDHALPDHIFSKKNSTYLSSTTPLGRAYRRLCRHEQVA